MGAAPQKKEGCREAQAILYLTVARISAAKKPSLMVLSRSSEFASQLRNWELKDFISRGRNYLISQGCTLKTQPWEMSQVAGRSGPCPLGTTSKDKQAHLGPVADHLSQHGGSPSRMMCQMCWYFHRPISTAVGTLCVAFYLAAAFSLALSSGRNMNSLPLNGENSTHWLSCPRALWLLLLSFIMQCTGTRVMLIFWKTSCWFVAWIALC